MPVQMFSTIAFPRHWPLLIALTFGLSWSGVLLAQSSPVSKSTQEQTWTLNFKDSDIQEVIKFVADVTGKTLIIDPQVKGRVRVMSAEPLNREQLYDLFLSVLEIHGFSAISIGNTVRVIPAKDVRTSPVPLVDSSARVNDTQVTQVIELKNIAASKVLPVIRPMLPAQAHVAAYDASNALIISDTVNNIARIRSLIERLDVRAVAKTELVALRYASAEDVVRMLNQITQKAARDGDNETTLIADTRSNGILISGDEASRERIKQLIDRLDQALPQSGNVRVLYLEYADAVQVARVLTRVLDNMSKLNGEKGASVKGQATVEADEDTNSLLITADPETLQSLLAVVKRLDIRRAQVLVEAIIVEIMDIAGEDLGIQWMFRDKNNGFGSSIIGDSAGSVNAIIDGAVDEEGGESGGLIGALTSIAGQTLGFGRTGSDVDFLVLLNALQEDTGANILSTPNLLTLDNHPASITVGQNVPFVTGSYTSTGGGDSVSNPFQTIERESVGIQLDVTPHINEGSSVVLDIVQEVSSLSGATGINASDVITNERKITTRILAEDGEIVVLGGLIKDDVQSYEQRVPLLGSIPGLGRLFRSTSTQVTKTNLVVFIRATVIRDVETLTGATAEKYRYIRDQQRQHKELGAVVVEGNSALLPEWPGSLPPDVIMPGAAETQSGATQ